jgi:hypothetical protein
MFRFGSKTAKSKISQKLPKKPQTTSKFRPRPNKSGNFFFIYIEYGHDGYKKILFRCWFQKSQLTLVTKCTYKKLQAKMFWETDNKAPV